jgi:peptidoglycan/xylan/chitin deacetylase (PgdA/CDA1 family)
MNAVIVTYHAIDTGASPLCVDPTIFRAHLESILERGWRTATITELGDALRDGELPDRTIALTFDDGFASVVDVAVPELAARGLSATVFCVAGHLGGSNDWPTDRAGGYQASLADADALREAAAAGLEIGSHGYRHVPLVSGVEPALHSELVESREVLEAALGRPVSSFAYPYGAGPSRPAAELVAKTYRAACGTRLGPVGVRNDVFFLPRMDAHYVRSPEQFRRLLDGRLAAYLAIRRLGAGARRVLRKDYLGP